MKKARKTIKLIQMPLPEWLTGAANALSGGILGMGLGALNDNRQYNQQERLQGLQIRGSKELTDYQMMKQLQMWKDTNYSAQMEQLRKAGLNPGLIYGMGGGGGQSMGNAGASVGAATATQGGGGEIGMAMQMSTLAEQKELLKAQAENIKADTANKTGVEPELKKAQTTNLSADTENKILQSVLLDVMGKDAESKWKEVTAPNRMIEGKMVGDEMTARQGLAGTIYELWIEGKLKEKSLAEIEAIALGNAKSRTERRKIETEIDNIQANTKGKNLENIITELEAKLQTQTGIDRNSPGWLKILGRLFVTLSGGN